MLLNVKFIIVSDALSSAICQYDFSSLGCTPTAITNAVKLVWMATQADSGRLMQDEGRYKSFKMGVRL